MKRETRSIGFACALGAFVGALTGIELSRYFNIGLYGLCIGAPIGGIVGYLAYDFKRVGKGVVRAWNETLELWSTNQENIRITILTIWHESKMLFGLSFWMSLPLSIILTLLQNETMERPLHWHFLTLNCIILIPSLLFLSLLNIFIPLGDMGLWDMKEMSRTFNLLTIPVLFARWLIVSMRALFYDFVPRALRHICSKANTLTVLLIVLVRMLMYEFPLRAFLYIHSEMRLLCFTDSFIGASIGYFYGNPIIGAVAGALLGVLNYEILSVRVLKLVPRT